MRHFFLCAAIATITYVCFDSPVFGQVVKPCKPTVCDAGTCPLNSDGGVIGARVLQFTGSPAPQQTTYRHNSSSRPYFSTGVAATYTAQVKFAPTIPNAEYQFTGGTYQSFALGGWATYLLPTTAHMVFVNCPANTSCTTALESAFSLVQDTWYTLCIHKSAADVFQFRIDNLDAGVSGVDTAGEAIEAFYLGQQPSFPGSATFVGKARNVAFLRGTELTNAQCAALSDGTLSINSLTDAGMVFGWTLNSTCDDISGNGRYLNETNDIIFATP